MQELRTTPKETRHRVPWDRRSAQRSRWGNVARWRRFPPKYGLRKNQILSKVICARVWACREIITKVCFSYRIIIGVGAQGLFARKRAWHVYFSLNIGFQVISYIIRTIIYCNMLMRTWAISGSRNYMHINIGIIYKFISLTGRRWLELVWKKKDLTS
jgi:hypothetical protein